MRHTVLRHPAIRLALNAPETTGKLRENRAVLATAATADAGQWAEWEEYGRLVYGDGTDSFETQYP